MNQSEKLLPRKIIPQINRYINTSEILLLVGSRQVGKTSILYLLMDGLVQKGISKDTIYYFDLEDISTLDIFNSGVKNFLAYLAAKGADLTKKNYIFVDEIQYMTNPTNFLKLVADRHRNLKLIVSGSSTLEIRQKFKDSLAGRKVVFEVYPLDFYEFLIFKDEERLAETILKSDIRHIGIKDPSQVAARFFEADLMRYFREYIIFGGYPKVALESEHDRKVTYLNEIYNSYVKKDIKDIMRVDNVSAFNNLLKTLALQVGNLINIAELSTSLKVARETIERYLFLLENTFIIKVTTPFSSNPRKEISKMPKVYFIDTGLRNMTLKNFSDIEDRADGGSLVENTAFSNILKNLDTLEEIHFWRTLSKNEVDFVILKGTDTTSIEVKYSTFKTPRTPSGIRSFLLNYPSKGAFVLNRDYFGKNNKVIFLPVWLC